MQLNVPVVSSTSEQCAVDCETLSCLSDIDWSASCMSITLMTPSYTVACRWHRWCSGSTGRALDLRSTGRGFNSYTRGKSCVTTLGKLFTPMCLCHQAVKVGTGVGEVMLCSWEGNHRPGEKWWQPTTGSMTYNHLYTGMSSGLNARQRLWEAFTFSDDMAAASHVQALDCNVP